MAGSVELNRSSYESFAKRDHDGFVFIFQRQLGEHRLRIEQAPDGEELICDPPLDMSADSELEGPDGMDGRSLLYTLKDKNLEACTFIDYDLVYSREHPDDFIYCVVSIDEESAMKWVDRMGYDLLIDAEDAVRVGRQLDCKLAQATCLPDEKEETMEVNGAYYQKIDISNWENIHLRFNEDSDPQIYKTYGAEQERLVNRVQLRVLYQILTIEKTLGGAQFLVNRDLANPNHPLVGFFALHESRDQIPRVTKEELIGWKRICSSYSDMVDPIRDYYGEYVGFYFLFLSHYTSTLALFALIGFIWFIIQLALGRIALNLGGDIVITLIGITWGTYMIETWHRKESTYKFKWGMLRVDQTSVPRPEFHGEVQLSTVNGELEELHQNICYHRIKLCCSTNTIFFFIMLVISVSVGVYFAKSLRPGNTGWSIFVGILNSIVIQIMNYIYIRVALLLNIWEDHRLQTEFDNHLAIKKITFYCINSFNSLVYIAFVQPYVCVQTLGKSCTNQFILNSLRIQLATLFFTLIFVQNMVELFLPQITAYVREYMRTNDDGEHTEDSPLLTEDGRPNTPKDDGPKSKLISEETWKDIETQMDCPPMINVLDEMAELIVPYGYIMLFIIVFPVMPLLGMINNFIEIRIDLFKLVESQRPVPRAVGGIGVWKQVIVVFSILAVFTNMGIVCYRSSYVENLVGENYVNTFFFIASMLIIAVQLVIRAYVPDVPADIEVATERQWYLEESLVTASVKTQIRKLKGKVEYFTKSQMGGKLAAPQ